MALELDHFFVITARNAQAADAFADLGMVEGSSNVHPGQGTANRRFFFRNSGLELLYVVDEHEARTGPGAGMRLADRASTARASPFGLILRGPADACEFPGWPYQPDYFAAGRAFVVGDNSDRLDEPLCVLMPPDPPAAPVMPAQAASFECLTLLRISVPGRDLSAPLAAAAAADRIEVIPGRSHFMEIEFGGGRFGESRDLSPRLPVRVIW